LRHPPHPCTPRLFGAHLVPIDRAGPMRPPLSGDTPDPRCEAPAGGAGPDSEASPLTATHRCSHSATDATSVAIVDSGCGGRDECLRDGPVLLGGPSSQASARRSWMLTAMAGPALAGSVPFSLVDWSEAARRCVGGAAGPPRRGCGRGAWPSRGPGRQRPGRSASCRPARRRRRC
jgi:hypothetical protein